MIYVAPLSETEQSALEVLYRSSPSYRVRQRAHAVLLSAQGHIRPQLARLFGVKADTISGWFRAWQQCGAAGLSDAPKSGRPRKLTG